MAKAKISTQLLQYTNMCAEKKINPFLCWIDKQDIDFLTDEGRHVKIDRPNVKPMPKAYRAITEQFRPTRLERDGYVDMWSNGEVSDNVYWFQENDHRLMAIALIITMLKEKGL